MLSAEKEVHVSILLVSLVPPHHVELFLNIGVVFRISLYPFFLSTSLSLSLSLSHTHTHTFNLTHTLTNSHMHICTHTHTQTLYLSLSHTHVHTLFLYQQSFTPPLQLVSVTKQMCGMRGSAPADFSLSLTRFLQQITSISRLVGLTRDTLHATVTTAHLMEVTAPGNFLHSPLQVCVCL